MSKWYSVLFLVLGLLLTACDQSQDSRSLNSQSTPPETSQSNKNTGASQELSVKLGPENKGSQESISRTPPENCPVTLPADPGFVPPASYPSQPPYEDYFWHGSELLWTLLPADGVWAALPQSSQGYTQKVFWWRDGYYWADEPEPDLIVSGRRLDAQAPALVASKATNAYEPGIQSSMLVGVDFPTLGCWEISGRYAGTTLSFVIWVVP